MVFELNLGAIRSAAKMHAATPGYVATVATKPAQSVATVASRHGAERLLTNAANDPAPDPWHVTLAPGTSPETAARFRAASKALDAAAGARTPAPPAHDPGESALLALAMAYCTHTGASDKARQDWQEDIANTPPELRGDLSQHLREQLRGQRPPAPAPAPAPAAPTSKRPSPGWLHLEQPWRELDRQYLQHHWQCPACKATSTGHSDRCAAGQHLHDDYAQAVTTAMKGNT